MANSVSHDQNFKNLIVDYPREALALFAPDEAPAPNEAAQIVPVRQEQLKERLGARFRALDTPLLVEWSDHRRSAILFVMEEESDRSLFSPHRLAQYCLDLALMFRTERVVPVTIFLRDTGPAPGSLVLRTERRSYLTFDYLVCAIREMPAAHWLESDNLVARVNLPNMSGGEIGRIEVYGEAVRGLLALEPDGGKRAKYLDFIDIYAGLTDNERQQYREQYPEENRAMAGIVQTARDEGMQQGVQQGIQQGVQQGIQQGRIEGERAVLERQLRRRFGVVAPQVADRLNRASTAELENWAENVLEAETLDDVFRRET